MVGTNRGDDRPRLVGLKQLGQALEECKRLARLRRASHLGKGGVDRRGRLLGDAPAVCRADGGSGQSSVLRVGRGLQDPVFAKRGDRLRDIALRQAGASSHVRNGAVRVGENVAHDERAARGRLRRRPPAKGVLTDLRQLATEDDEVECVHVQIVSLPMHRQRYSSHSRLPRYRNEPWPRIRAFLDADIAYRARRLAAGGPAALFADLNTGVTWKRPELRVEIPRHEATIQLDGRGLLLVPSAFAATRPFVSDRAPWLPALIYPARGIATLWQQADTAPAALARLIGRTRAAILADLAAPRSTTELSDRLSLSPAATSHHLTTLRDAGLLSTCREGRSVLYVRTALGDTLAASGG